MSPKSCKYLAVFIGIVSIYIGFAYYRISTTPPFEKIVYAIRPELFVVDTYVPVPFVGTVMARHVLSMEGAEVAELIRTKKLTPWSILSLSLTAKETRIKGFEQAQAMTEHFLNFGLDIDAPDAYGCSSLHNSIIVGEDALIDYLNEKLSHRVVPGNPEARVEKCRLDTRALSQKTGKRV